jgi:hypothetical protein
LYTCGLSSISVAASDGSAIGGQHTSHIADEL